MVHRWTERTLYKNMQRTLQSFVELFRGFLEPLTGSSAFFSPAMCNRVDQLVACAILEISSSSRRHASSVAFQAGDAGAGDGAGFDRTSLLRSFCCACVVAVGGGWLWPVLRNVVLAKTKVERYFL